MTDTPPLKRAVSFYCNCCDFTTSKKSNYTRHLTTPKHIKISLKLTNTDKNEQKEQNNQNELAVCVNKYECKCGKKYLQRQSLFTHKKKCIFLQEEILEEKTIPIDSTKIVVNSSVILDIIKENQEFKTLLIEQSEFHQKQVIELQKENNILLNKMVEISQNSLIVPSVVNTNNTINNNNNQFNLNIFLNETCKNAINFSDFIDNIQVTDDDLENNIKMGFVEGVTKIIMDNLRLLELTNRPIHCTDAKRETIYVKVEEQWDKDNSIKVIQRGIQDITCKNMQQLVDWRENNPSYADDMDSELGEKSIMMQQNSMAGPKREEYYPKIIRNIAKESIISNKNGLIKK
jgi:hypothetical protein